MNPAYEPKTPEGRLAHLTEECGEVLKEIGKAGRFGMDDIAPGSGDSPRQRLLAEIDDLLIAASRVRDDLMNGELKS